MPVRSHVSGRLFVKPGQTMPAELQLPHIGVLPSHGELRRRHSQHCGPLGEIVILAGGGSSYCGAGGGIKRARVPGWRSSTAGLSLVSTGGGRWSQLCGHGEVKKMVEGRGVCLTRCAKA